MAITKEQTDKLQQIIENSDGFLFAKDILNIDIKALEQAVLKSDEGKKAVEFGAYAKERDWKCSSEPAPTLGV